MDVGTAVDNVVQLEDVGGGTPGLPAVDGSQLTNLPSGGGGGLTVHSGTGTNSADILANQSAVVVVTVTGSPGVTAATYLPPSAKTDNPAAEPDRAWISGTDEISVRVLNTGTSTIVASTLTVTAYATSTDSNAQSGTGTNSADIVPNETVVVITTIAGSPGVTSATHRPQPAETDDPAAEPGACWISGTDEVSVRVENTGDSTISSAALTVTSYVVAK